MAFEAWLQDREGTYYLLKGEGGNIHVYRVDDWGRSGLGQAFHTVGEAICAANEDSQEREGGGVDKRGRGWIAVAAKSLTSLLSPSASI